MDVWMGLCPPYANTGLRMRDNGICLVGEDGILLAISEERLSRVKHDHRIDNVMGIAGLMIHQKSYRIVNATISTCSDSAQTEKAFSLPGHTVRLARSHHYSHALSAYASSPFEDAIVLVMDAGGNTLHSHETKSWWQLPREQTSLWYGAGGHLELLKRWHSSPFDIGFGEWYRAFTYYLGWPSHMLSGNTMALASYGDASEVSDLSIWDEDDSGTLRGAVLNEPSSPVRMVSSLLARLHADTRFGQRIYGEPWTYEHACVAAYVQWSLEQAVERLVKSAIKAFNQPNVILTGGVAQNCVMTAKLAHIAGIGNIHVSGYSGDVGQCVGNALDGRLADLGVGAKRDVESLFLGLEYTGVEVAQALREYGIKKLPLDKEALAQEVAQRVAAGQVVGIYTGRGEFGPRALGHRSIICDPVNGEAVRRVKSRVKQRDDFMPLAPAISQALASELNVRPMSRTMTVAPKLADFWRIEFGEGMHIDGTARIQVCDGDSFLGHTLSAFSSLTGRRVLINTSFNKRGDPIVDSPRDALQAAYELGIDAVVLNDTLVTREELLQKQ